MTPAPAYAPAPDHAPVKEPSPVEQADDVRIRMEALLDRLQREPRRQDS